MHVLLTVISGAILAQEVHRIVVYHHQVSDSNKPFFPLDGLSGLASALFLPLLGFPGCGFSLPMSSFLGGTLVGVALATLVGLWTLVGQHW